MTSLLLLLLLLIVVVVVVAVVVVIVIIVIVIRIVHGLTLETFHNSCMRRMMGRYRGTGGTLHS